MGDQDKPKLFGIHILQSSEDNEMTDEQALEIGRNALRQVRKYISEKEQWAVKSMIAYIAYSQKVAEETVREMLYASMNIEELEYLPSAMYKHAIEYLVDLEVRLN